MKQNITRHIDECLLTGQERYIRTIVILLNGWHCKIHYLASGDYALRDYRAGAGAGRVAIWHHQVNDPGVFRLSDIAALEAGLEHALGRVIAGSALVWNGKAHVSSPSDDALLAYDEIKTVLARFQVTLVQGDRAGHEAALPPHVILDLDWMARGAPQELSAATLPTGGVGKGESPVVSVIVGVHNKAPFIQECLESVCAQGIDDLEVICIDDASTDGSLDAIGAVAQKDPRIRLIRNERNLGAGPTRNIGLDAATGTYLMFLDADDLLAPHALMQLLAEAGATDSDLVRGGIAFYFAGATPLLRAADTPPDRRGYRLADEPHLWIPWWFTTYLYRRSFLSSYRIHFPELRDGEDPVFLARALIAAESISSISDTVYYYRQHGGQKRNDYDFLAHLAAVRELFNRHDPRVWNDGYGMYIAAHDLPLRLRRVGSPEARQKLRQTIVSLDIFPERILRPLLDEAV